VYFHRQPPFVSGEQSYAQTKALVTFDSAAGTLREFVNGAWRNERIAGRGFSHLPAGVPHEVRWESEADVIEIYYEPAFLRELPPENVTSVLARDALPAAADDPVIWDLALAICLWCADGMPASTIITDLGLLIGKRLFLRHGEPRATKTGPRFTTEQRRRLDDHIRTNIAKPIRVPQLAKAVSVSVSHFNVLCRNTTGKSAMDYLREWRLWKAHAMAQRSHFFVNEFIAQFFLQRFL